MEKIIHTFQKSSDQQIYISRRTYKGMEFLDIRIMYQSPSGDLIPTKKGVTIPTDEVYEFLKAFDLIEEEFFGDNKKDKTENRNAK